MKRLIFTCLFAGIFSICKSQIVLENTYAPLTGNPISFFVVKLGYAGYKYVSFDQLQNTFTFYNLNHSLYKTISVPVQNVSYTYISDNLFDLDSAIEYMAWTFSAPPYWSEYIFKEDGSVLFSRDSLVYIYAAYTLPGVYDGVVSTDSGTKLIVHRLSGTEVYALPGNLVCQQCNGEMVDGASGISGVNNINFDQLSLSNCYPNPADHSTRIDYSLPQNVSKGEIIFYELNGKEWKRFTVTNAFHSLTISTQDLPPGTYYYQLVTSSGISNGRKMVVIR